MGYGCDTAATLDEARLRVLLERGMTFVGRYLAGRYALTKEEKQCISRAGLYLVSIWECGSPTNAGYFTRAQGQSDAVRAIEAAKTLGQPQRTPIYFTVDYDASSADINGSIRDYLQEVKAVFRSYGDAYSLGLYGSGAVLQYFENSFPYTWLAGAGAWRGSAAYHNYCLRQYGVNTPFSTGAGWFSVDLDESNGAAGGWK